MKTLLACLALAAPAAADPVASGGWADLPLTFEENAGQTDPRVRFLARGGGYTLFLTDGEAVLVLRRGDERCAVRMRVLGAEPRAPRGEGPLATQSHYFLGDDPAAWRTDVGHFGAVRYAGVLDGVDLVFHGAADRRLEYDFEVASGADPGAIELRFEGVDGLALDEEGRLVIGTPLGDLVQDAPRLYQMVAGEEREVDGRFELRGDGRVGFRVGPHDEERELVIDPVLLFSTYLGGSGMDVSEAIAADAQGSAYVTGATTSLDFPIRSGSYQTTHGGGYDVFVTKLDPGGTYIVYSTFLGGAGGEWATGIAVNAFGWAYVTGSTGGGFPTTPNAYQTASAGSFDAFLTALDASGSGLLFSTYLGGSSYDVAEDVELLIGRYPYVVGETYSADFPLAGGQLVQDHFGGVTDAFLTVFDPWGASLSYSTLLGGNGYDAATGVGIDATGAAFLAGRTSSTAGFPLKNADQGVFGGGAGDAFVARVDPWGSTYPWGAGLTWSTYHGGSGVDGAFGIAVKSSGEAYVAGRTQSANFPVLGGAQGQLNGIEDAFVTLYDANGKLLRSTYWGGPATDYARGVAVDGAGRVWLAGYAGIGFPEVAPILPPGGGDDAFVVQLDHKLGAVGLSTLFGGFQRDYADSLAIGPGDTVFVTGLTDSAKFPTTPGVLQVQGQGGSDAFVLAIQ